MQPVPLPAHYFTAAGGTTVSAADPTDTSGTQMHPAVLQHLLQQQQFQQQLQLLQQLQGGAFATAPPSLAPPPPMYAGAPLMQGTASALGLPPIGPSARSDSASTSASSSVENTQSSSSPPSCSTDGSEAVRLHISNIPYKWRDPDLKTMFAEHGEVIEAEVIFNDRGSKGFGFVTMANKEGADAAKTAINCKIFDGRKVEVNAATVKMSGRQKAKVLQATHTTLNPHLQLAMLQQQQQLAPAVADPLTLQMLMQQQQLYAANAILAQYQQQQQQLQGLQQPAALMQQQPQLQQWMLQQQLAPAAASLDLEKHQRRMTEELMKQQQARYRPY